MNTRNEQDAALSEQPTTLVEQEGREVLISKFRDLQSPTGDDFEAMIRSSFNQVDDPIAVVEHDGQSELEVSSALTLNSAQSPDEQLRLTAQQLSMTQGASSTLTVNKDSMTVFGGVLKVENGSQKVTLADTLHSQVVDADSAVNTAKVNTEALVVNKNNKAILTAELDSDGDPLISTSGRIDIDQTLTVAGESTTNTLTVSADSSLGRATARSITVTNGDTTTCTVDENGAIFHQHLEAESSLGVGIDAGSTRAKLHVAKRSSDTDALFRVDDYDHDSTPFFINSEGKVGAGTTDIHASFHVAGDAIFAEQTDFLANVSVSESMSIGSDHLPTSAGSLAVDGKLAVGKVDATAKLDIHGAINSSLLNVETDAMTFVTITDAVTRDEEKITLHQKTKVKEALDVDKTVTAQDVTARNQLNGSSASITETLTASSLKATTDTHTNKLWVGNTGAGTTEQDSAKGAVINTTMTVKDSADFKDIHATENINTDKTVNANNVNIGGQGEPSSSKLSVKTSELNESALLIKSHQDRELMRVDSGSVQVGSEAMPVPFNVNGTVTSKDTVTAPTLSITTQANVHQAYINQQVSVATPSEQTGWLSSAKLAVLSDMNNSSGIELSHFNGQRTETVIASYGAHLGLFTDNFTANPGKALHVGKSAVFRDGVDFDSAVKFASNLTAYSESGEMNFCVSDIEVAIGQSEAPTSFKVFADTTSWGKTTVNGGLNVQVDGQSIFNTTDAQVQITQLGETAALKVSEVGAEGKVTHVAAGQLAINQALDANREFALTGKAKIAGDLLLEGEQTVLDVKGKTELYGALDVYNATTIQDGLTVSVTNNSAEVEKDALYVTGCSTLNGALSVLHGGLTVDEGQSIFNDMVTVNAPTVINSTLTSKERFCANGGAVVAAMDEGNSLQVQGKAQFDRDVAIDGDLNFSDKPSQARVHIQEQGKQGLLIESFDGEVGLVFNDGRLGIGTARPDCALDVTQDSKFRKDVEIKGRLEVAESLHVDEYASFRSNLNVHGNSELAGEARFGLPFSTPMDDEATGLPAGFAQVAIDQNHFAKAFAVYHQGEKPFVIEDGCVGIQTDSPREALDVAGNAHVRGDIILDGKLRGSGFLECFNGATIFGDVELRSDLTVNDDVHLKDTLVVDGIATFNRHVELTKESTFQGSVRLNDELSVQKSTLLRDDLVVLKDTTLRGSLTLEGLEADSQVTVSPKSTFTNSMTVHGHASFLSTLETTQGIKGPSLAIAGKAEEATHVISLDSNSASAPLNISTAGSDALHINAAGDVGIGTQTPACKLDVHGNAHVRDTLVVDKVLELSEGAVLRGSGAIEGHINASALQLGESQSVDTISVDIELGGESSSNTTLATQAAVKAYVDAHCWTLAENHKVLMVQNQQEFDDVMMREQLCNLTILLMPHTCHPQMSRAYKLKQPVRIGSNVSIIGFNQRETRIVKEHAGCRFLIHGQSDALIKGIEMRGFTFDGSLLNGGRYEGNGGAFHLRCVQNAKLNCVIENHHVTGDGGAIYAEADVCGVEALHIKNCSALCNGGGVYGVNESTLQVSHCQAEQGGGVAYCDDCQVVATDNNATLYGGGAYKCQNLMAQGYWRHNTAQGGIGRHIYSAGCDTEHDDHTHQDFWWHALYLDGPVMCGTQPWRNDHF
ncbi:hypothetical protein ACSLBF_19410 (plasmid) [Pseudoalteromonas sp. T1lg65]|uniref:hypothetical protein n=1 Tax=Pseudoalteromonas sp. T1lg65 TaxID=2077101 RepID=UPI003F79F250